MALMMSYSCLICSNSFEDIDSPSTNYFCLDCDSNICNSCKKVHDKFPILKEHSLIKYEEGNSFPTTSLTQAIKCHHHNGENREFYCADHCTSFCFTCFLQDHRQCEHSERIAKLANAPNQSVRLDEMINRIEKQQKTLEIVHDHKKANLQALNEERPILEAEMASIIEKISTHVRSVIDETGNLLNTEIQALEEDMQEIKRNLKNLDRQKIEITQVSNVCTYSNTFLFLNDIENILSKNDDKFEKMKSDCSNVKLILYMSDNIGTLLKNITNVSIDRTSARIPSSSTAMIPSEAKQN